MQKIQNDVKNNTQYKNPAHQTDVRDFLCPIIQKEKNPQANKAVAKV